MCLVCGCGAGHGDHGHDHDHDHGRAHDQHPAEADLHFGQGLAGSSLAGMEQSRIVRLERDILALNATHAERNRQRLRALGVLALNLISSPGAGKTTLLVATIKELAGRMPVAVIEGDQETSLDADRIRATGAPAIQINTGKGCHLDGHMVEHALDRLDIAKGAVLFVENVGNLVCPAAFDLGEDDKVVILSVTEGDDKPLKYPDIFAAARLMVMTKADLLPHVRFDAARCLEAARRINPEIEALTLSAETGQGMAPWVDWLLHRRDEGMRREAALR